MVIKKLNQEIQKFYINGLKDENFVMEAVQNTLGGKCEKSTPKEDRFQHVDFWWDSPKKGRIGIDVKGIKKKNRNDSEYDDTIHWIEIKNVNGENGWIYGNSEYIAFRTNTKIIFVKNTVLQKLSEDKVVLKDLVFKNPKECYVPYQRWGRKDVVYKIPTCDLINISDFIIDC